MKKYMLFGWDRNDSQGGLNDLIDSFDTFDQLNEYVNTRLDNLYNMSYMETIYDNYECVDRDTFERTVIYGNPISY